VKKVSQSGFYNKAANHIFSQRIAISNTKAGAINDFKVIDQVPVSEDALHRRLWRLAMGSSHNGRVLMGRGLMCRARGKMES
jgi:hypothetical protein